MTATAEARIYDAGWHFVLCAPSKRPIWRGWNRLRPTADVAALHRAEDGPVGIVPWSLHSTALDVDHGDPRALFEQFAAWADLPSRRGRHAYYDDDEPRANTTWAALGCRGDIRGAKGYLVLHADGCERLAEALDHRVPGTRPFPRDLFDLGLGDPAVASAPVPTRRDPLPVRAGAVVDLQLDRVWPGARHTAHFNQVRWWAYAQTRGNDLRAWLVRVESYALRQNERFPVPVPEVDARATARSVATFWGMERGRVVRPRLPGAVEAGHGIGQGAALPHP